jgi:Integrase core domain.
LLHGREKRGRPRKYGSETIEALKTVWEAEDRLCSKRLHPFLGDLVKILKKHGEIKISPVVEKQLHQISPSTIDRILRPLRQKANRHHFSTTRPGSLLKNAIPIRTFADWHEDSPGFLEVDLVAHCGESVDGFYLNTLTAVDIATGWTECSGVWGKGQDRVGAAIHNLRSRLPFPLLGLDSDNGSEFINQNLYHYCLHEHITFTRSRAYKKNDGCHVEQKNGALVRKVIGYQRYNSKQALEMLNRIYSLLRLYTNFFQPSMKLTEKHRQGAKVYKVYDEAQTPCYRLLKSGILSAREKRELMDAFQSLSPVRLLQQINDNLKLLWDMADKQAVQ